MRQHATLLLLLIFATPSLWADDCDDYGELAGYGIIGEDKFEVGKDSTINGQPINGSGNTPTPTGNMQTVDLDFPSLSPASFPATGGSDINAATIPPGSYDEVKTSKENTYTFSGGTYYIEKLKVEEGATIILGPGTYFIEKLEMKKESTLNISGGGVVINIKDEFKVAKESEVNQGGNITDLSVNLYGDAKFKMEKEGQFAGILYAPSPDSKIEFKKESEIHGAIFSAGEVKLDKEVEITYGSGDQDDILDHYGCSGDSTPPTAPTVNNLTTNDNTPVITGTFDSSDDDGGFTVQVNGVTYTLGSSAELTNSGNNWTLDLSGITALDDGTYEVTATATDGSGNSTSDTSSNELVIDATGPTAPTVNSQITNDPTPVITGTFDSSDDDGGFTVQVNGVTYTLGSSAELTNSGNNWTLDLSGITALGDGTYEVTATATDGSGNSSSDSSTDELVIDATGPTAPTVNSQITNDPTPVITGTFDSSDDDGGFTVQVNGVTYTLGSSAELTNSGNNWTLDLSGIAALGDGAYEVTATATDGSGNSTSDSSSNELVIDQTPPLAPTVNAQTTNDTTPVITGTFNSAEVGSSLSVQVDGVTYTLGTDAELTNSGDNWSLDLSGITPLAEGTYEVTAVATDYAGNSSSDTSNNELVIDTTSPNLPTVNALTTQTTTPTITGTFDSSDVGGGFTVQVNGVTYTLGSSAQLTQSGDDWSLDLSGITPLADGTYEVTATATDSGGNSTTDATSNELVIDTTPPTNPTVNALTTDDTTPVISGTYDSSETGGTLTVQVNGVTYTLGTDAELTHSGNNWSLDLSGITPLTLGTYEVVVTHEDAAGNSSGDLTNNELEISDSTPPDQPTVNALSTLDTTPTITGTFDSSDADGGLSVTINGTTYTLAGSPKLTNSGNNWTLNLDGTTPLTAGTYNVTATATDGSGNSSSDATTNEITITASTCAIDFYADGSADTIGPQIAGKPSSTAPGTQTLTLRATGSCSDDVSGLNAVMLAYACVDPSSCHASSNDALTLTALDTDGSTTLSSVSVRDNSAASVSDYISHDLKFDSSGIAHMRLNYTDSGQIRLYATMDITEEGITTNYSADSNTFVVRPFGFDLDFNDDRANNGTTGSSYAADHNGSVFTTAGSDFSTQITAVLWESADDSDNNGQPDSGANLGDNSATPNFGQEGSADSLSYGYSLTAPTGGDNGTFTATTVTVGGGSSSFTNGVATSTMNWDEVGIIDISASLNNYLGESSADLSGAVVQVGRFVPHSFNVTSTNGQLANTHTSGANPFTYIGETFGYQVEPTFTITARNADGDTSQNYRGDYMTLTANEVSLTYPTADTTQNNAAGSSRLAVTATPGTHSLTDNDDGSVSLMLDGDTFQYDHASGRVAPFAADLAITLTAINETSDGVSYSGSDSVTPAANLNRYGRVVLPDSYGVSSSGSQAALPLLLQQWDGSGYTANGDDLDTLINSADLACSDPDTGDGLSCINPTADLIGHGGAFTITANGQAGTLRYTLDLSATPHLRSDWDGDGSDDDDPSASLVFDTRYQGDDRFLYWRESE